jgi:hypothetical protein
LNHNLLKKLKKLENWVAAMEEEIHIEKNVTWELVDEDREIIGVKWVIRQLNPDCLVQKYKSKVCC